MFVTFTIACAVSSNIGMLLAFRFLASTFGSASQTNSGGTIADVVRKERRGVVMSLFTICLVLGPTIGPIAGSYLAKARGWRWIFWTLALLSGVLSVLQLMFIRETYAVVLLEKRTQRQGYETASHVFQFQLSLRSGHRRLIWHNILRPTKLLLYSPVVLCISIYVGIVFGYLYLLFTTFPSVFGGQYGFSLGHLDLTYLGLGIGSFLGLAITGFTSDRILQGKSIPNEDGSPRQLKPEYRILLLVYLAPLVPAGFFIYGWAAEYRVHFVIPILGTTLIGMGGAAVFTAVSTYLVDSFTIHATSALAANTLIRSTVGAVLPLAGPKMYKSLGLGWGNTILGLIAMIFLPLPWVLYKHGQFLRKKFNVCNVI